MKCCNNEEKEFRKLIMDNETANLLSEFFKIYGDATRIKIIQLISNTELCVAEIAKVLEMSQSSISHQLKILRIYRLVKTRKEGKHVFYSLNDEHIMQIFKNGLEHISE